MAGFFGLFDYTKEGPGVEKKEKKKKGFFAFFEIYFRNFWNYAKAAVFYWVCSVLLITNGMAKVGLTNITRSTVREKHSFIISDFFEAIKKNWKQALSLGTLNVFATAILALDLWFFWNAIGQDFSAINILGLALAFFLGICLIFMKYYIWTLVITFNFSFKQLIKNSYHFVFINLWRNIFIAATLGVIYFALYILAIINQLCFILAAAILIFVVPGFKSSLIQANTFPVIKKHIIDPYYAEHKGEDIEKRLALGLEVSEDEIQQREETEQLFHDSTPEK